MTERYDQSRVWTCEVKEWSRRQSRATREANKAAEAPGEGKGHSSSPDTKNPDKLLDSLLAKDPVWRDVIAHRKQKGPNRPVTDEEREALGTRAELHIIGYSAPFYKILNKGEIEEGYQLRQVEGLKGGGVPPWFPDLKECQECIIGAAYAASKDGYPLGKPVLACFNQEHYLEKLQAGLAAYQEQLSAQQKGIERQDDRAIQDLKEALLSAPALTKYPLAQALLSATPDMPGWHPLGIPPRRLLLRNGATGHGEGPARHNRPVRPSYGNGIPGARRLPRAARLDRGVDGPPPASGRTD